MLHGRPVLKRNALINSESPDPYQNLAELER